MVRLTPPASEPESQSKPEQPLVDPFTPAVGGVVMMPKLLAFDAVPRVGEMRRVGQVEDLHPELHRRGRRPARTARKTLKSKLAKPGPRMLLKPAVPNRRSVTGAERQRIEPRIARPDAAEDLDLVLDLIGHLVAARQMSDVPDEVIVNGGPEYALKSPFTCQPPSSAAADAAVVQERLAVAERQLRDKRGLEVVRAVVRQPRLVQIRSSRAPARCGGLSLSVSQQMPNAFDHV